ncbi:MAG: right-handed parallel beta-helix repeat-containing protein [Candidatus Limivivens sp.]|nr:right-handed parallel beta-helix repeat-containing protein [Candidatus Limivivens sp.]
MSRVYHVNQVVGRDWFPGTEEQPFRTISQGARTAMPGDTVLVHAGVYREWVKPENSGTGEITRIVYEAAEGEEVVIKGSERIQSWEQVEGEVWKAVLPNAMFGDFNPYKEVLNGDWFIAPDLFASPYEEEGVLKNFPLHLGDVYLNGKSFYEAGRLEDVMHPVMRPTGVNPPWTKHPEPLLHPEDSVYQWYAEVDEEAGVTTIYANFQGADPNKELTEINVRKCCFYPERTGRNYITVRGFEMAQAACPWTPPTADQPGLLGAHWSKGWIIENNHIHDAKCSAISIGKEESTGHNMCTRTQRKPGYQYQMEAVFRARRIGWSKGTIGGHIIRNNVIHDCGQNGIVGHMGCVFSTIEHNHIYNIAVKHEFFGYEIAGVKLHAAIDVQLLNNNIHNSTLGAWFDWQAQGLRVSGNLFYGNDRDLMIEVTHGPYKVDNNIFASDYNFDNVAQGGAYLHNLCCGTMRRIDTLDRSTPYHFPHSTEVAGCVIVYSGDDRLYQNIFVGGAPEFTPQSKSGTAGYNGHPSSWEEYQEMIASKGNSDHEKFQETPQAVYINRNVYLKGAPAFGAEKENFLSEADPRVKILEEVDGTYLEMDLEEGVFQIPTEIIETNTLGMPRITEAPFDDPDGNPIIFNRDYFGAERGENPVPGPMEGLHPGHNRVRVW